MNSVYLYSGTHLLRLVVEMTSPTQWQSHLWPSSLVLSSHPPLSLWLLNTMWTTLSVLWLPTVLGTVQPLSITLVLVSRYRLQTAHYNTDSLLCRRLSCVDQPHERSLWTSLQQISRIHSNYPVWRWVCVYCYNGDMWGYTDVESRPWDYCVYITNHTYSYNSWVELLAAQTLNITLTALMICTSLLFPLKNLILFHLQPLQWIAQHHYPHHRMVPSVIIQYQLFPVHKWPSSVTMDCSLRA